MRRSQEQPSLMNYQSKECIQIDRRKWNDLPACDNVDKTEQVIGVLCFRRCDVIADVKLREASQTLHRWVIYTEKATNPDFSTAQTRTATSCMFALFKVTQEES